MNIRKYLKVSGVAERCLFINVSDISLKLFNGSNFKKNFKVVLYNSESNSKSIIEYIKRLNIKIVVLETSTLNHLPEDFVKDIITARLILGVKVYDAQEFYEIVNRRVPLIKLTTNTYLADDIFSIGLKRHSWISTKRIIDLLVSFLFLPIAIPLILIGCILTKLTSKGRVFFVQQRVGKGACIFSIYKIRTMTEVHDGGFTQMNDNRITFIGRILRTTKIDELPQLFNIIKGDMSLVGPRPERPEFVDVCNDEIAYYGLRHIIKPGITGWAQVNLPKATPDDNLKKLEFDLYYIKNYNYQLDLEIFLKTIRIVFTLDSN